MKLFVVFLCAVVAVGFASPKSPITTLKDFEGSNSRIISGQPAVPGQFPWQVVNRFRKGSSTSFCGAALICDRWVLTAAHCTLGAEHFTIYLGSVNQSQAVEPGRVVVETTEAYTHENYSTLTLNHDIALIKLRERVNFTDRIQPIRLGDEYTGANITLTISGWGKTSDGPGGVSPILNYVDLRSITNKQCESIFGSEVIINSTICCRGNPEHSPCYGDSGSPLIQKQDNGEFVHIGIASFVSSSGCSIGRPSGFIRSISYRAWINKHINGTCKLP